MLPDVTTQEGAPTKTQLLLAQHWPSITVQTFADHEIRVAERLVEGGEFQLAGGAARGDQSG